MTTHQIISAEGLYATCGPYYIGKVGDGAGNPWLCEDFCARLRAASELAKPVSELASLCALLLQAEFSDGPDLLLPQTPAQAASIEAKMAAFRIAVKKSPSQHGIYASSWNSTAFLRDMEEACARHRFKISPKKKQKWIYFPKHFGFKDDPGKACMVEADKGAAIVERCALLARIAELLPKASSQAKKLVGAFPQHTPPTRKLPDHVSAMATAQCRAFAAAEAYASRECFAVYLGAHGSHRRRGFLTARGNSAPDLGSAWIFPTRKIAESKASSFSASAVVVVEIAPKSYAPCGAAPDGSFSELAAVIAAKEAAEIDAAIKGARIEELEAELAARAAQSAPAAKTPPRGRL